MSCVRYIKDHVEKRLNKKYMVLFSTPSINGHGSDIYKWYCDSYEINGNFMRFKAIGIDEMIEIAGGSILVQEAYCDAGIV